MGGRQHFGLYGNVVIPREYCPHCRQWAFVIEGKLACCAATTDLQTHRTKRMSEAPDFRKQPTEEEKRRILEAQENQCLYCLRSFRSAVVRKDKLVFLKLNWDHFVPYSYSQNNYPYNFVAACQICNGIKGSLMFKTVDEARVYITALSTVEDLPTSKDA